MNALRDARIARNLDVAQVAVMAGVAATAVRRAEAGGVVSGRVMAKIARALGVAS